MKISYARGKWQTISKFIAKKSLCGSLELKSLFCVGLFSILLPSTSPVFAGRSQDLEQLGEAEEYPTESIFAPTLTGRPDEVGPSTQQTTETEASSWVLEWVDSTTRLKFTPIPEQSTPAEELMPQASGEPDTARHRTSPTLPPNSGATAGLDEGAGPSTLQSRINTLHDQVLSIAQNNSHPDQWDALTHLLLAAAAQGERHYNSVFPTLLEIMGNQGHPHQWNAINLLEGSPAFKAPYGTLLRSQIRLATTDIARNFQHANQWTALSRLWTRFDDWHEHNRIALYDTLLQIAQDFESLQQWAALTLLWNSKDVWEVRNRIAICPTLLKIAQNNQHLLQLEAISLLWYPKYTSHTAHVTPIRPTLIAIAQNAQHLRQWDAISLLWYSTSTHYIEDREIARPLLLAIASNPLHPRSNTAIVCLHPKGYSADD